MRRKFVLLIAVIFLMGLLANCATTSGTTMTPKQQAAVWFNVYDAQYDDTMQMATTGTPAQKDTAAKKKAILVQLWPLLKIYAAVVDGGGTPSTTDVATITALINQLTALVPTN